MEEFNGFISTVFEAFVLVEASSRGLIATQTQRLNFNNRDKISSGTAIIFNETLTGMSRWIDGKVWSPSRFKDGFFIYRELVPGSKTGQPKHYTGLCKKAISILSPKNHHFHVISYYNEANPPSTSVESFISKFTEQSIIWESAGYYRYYKCFRTKSDSWRQPCSAPPHQLTRLKTRKSNHQELSQNSSELSLSSLSPVNNCTISLPPIAALLNLTSTTPNYPPRSEDQRLLHLIASKLSL